VHKTISASWPAALVAAQHVHALLKVCSCLLQLKTSEISLHQGWATCDADKKSREVAKQTIANHQQMLVASSAQYELCL